MIGFEFLTIHYFLPRLKIPTVVKSDLKMKIKGKRLRK